MGDLLTFARRKPVAAPPRTEADDEHDVSNWLGIAQEWGWSAKAFHAPEHPHIRGYIFMHDALSEEMPLYTLLRGEDDWRLHSRRRDLTEHASLDAALQSIFPTAVFSRRAP